MEIIGISCFILISIQNTLTNGTLMTKRVFYNRNNFNFYNRNSRLCSIHFVNFVWILSNVAGKWCRHGECVPERRDEVVVDGGWGPWGRWGGCSRSCGGGVRRSERRCDQPAPANGGQYCTGSHVKHRSCSLEPCPDPHKDFRAEQCAKFDGSTFNLTGLTPGMLLCFIKNKEEELEMIVVVRIFPIY